MVFGLQVDAEKRIAIGILWGIDIGITSSGLAGTGCRLIRGSSLHDGIFSQFLRGREPQLRRLHLAIGEQLRQI